jgi:hypothetical protein
MQRAQMEGRMSHPIGQCRSIEMDALTGVEPRSGLPDPGRSGMPFLWLRRGLRSPPP